MAEPILRLTRDESEEVNDECQESWLECTRSRQARVDKVLRENPDASIEELARLANVTSRTINRAKRNNFSATTRVAHRRAPTAKFNTVRSAVRKLIEGGQSVSREKLAAEFDVGPSTIQRAQIFESGRLSGLQEAQLEEDVWNGEMHEASSGSCPVMNLKEAKLNREQHKIIEGIGRHFRSQRSQRMLIAILEEEWTWMSSATMTNTGLRSSRYLTN